MPLVAECKPESANIVLKQGYVVNEKFSSLEVHDVWLVDGLIRAVGDAQQWNLPPATEVRDVSGCTVAPGIIDGHVHISYLNAKYNEEQHLYTPLEYRTLVAAQMANRALAAGVTTIVVPGVMGNIGVAVRDAVNSGLIDGPRILSAGRYLSPLPSYPSWVPELPSDNRVLAVDESAIRAEIYRQCNDRVDIIKILGSGEGDTGHIPTYLERDVKLIADLAHLQDKCVFMHARAGRAALFAARAGVDVVLHADYMNDAEVEEFLEYDSYLSPVLTLGANAAMYGTTVGMSERRTQFYQERLDGAVEVIRKLWQGGVRLIAGTESGFSLVPHGEWHTREMELFVELLGLTPLEALQAGTQNVADAVGIGATVGSIAPGKVADVLVVRGRIDEQFTYLGDPSRRVSVFSGGHEVTVRPGRERRPLPFEGIRRLSSSFLHRADVS
jgi:imidazolonepropionase-like amidohydrolase